MSQTPRTRYDEALVELIHEATTHDLKSEEFADASKNLTVFAAAGKHLPDPEPEPEPESVPETTWGKVMARTAAICDNETTRVFIKAGGAFAGVALVVWSTIHRDHVVEKTSLQQANQNKV